MGEDQTPAASVAPAESGGHRPGRARRAALRRVLAIACLGQFMVVLDVSVVNVALPSIRESVGFDLVSQQWVVNAYTLAFAGFLLLGGRLADLYGRRRAFVAGLLLFTAASLVGGLATAPGTLVAARAAQGLGAAVLAPATLTVLTTAFAEGPERTRALATWTAVSVAGGAAGNLLGGLLTEYLTWRATLLVNVPLGAAAVVLALRFLAADRTQAAGRRVDVAGAVTATAGLVAFTYGIVQAQTRGFAAPATAAALAVGAAALAAFVLVEARRRGNALVPPRLFRNRAVSIGNLIMLLAGAALQTGMWFFLAQFLQNVLGYTALETGLAFLPHAVVTIVGARLAPRIMSRVDGRTLIGAGALIAAAGFCWQAAAAPGDTYLSGILGPAVVLSLGGGLMNTPITATVTSGVDESDAGAASGVMNTAKQAGGALGLAALVTLASRASGTLSVDYGTAFLAIAALLAAVAVLSRLLPPSREGAAPSTAEPRGEGPRG